MTVFFIIILGFGAVTVFYQFLWQQQLLIVQADRREKARFYLDSVVNLALQKFDGDDKFADDILVSNLPENSKECFGKISFKNGSVNNLSNEEPVELPDRRILPGNCALLKAEAHFDGVVVREDVVLGKPPFPYSLASAGPLKTEGPFLLGAIQDLADLEKTGYEEKLHPSSLASNSSGSPAIQLHGGPIHIKGSVVAPGTIDSAGATIDGMVQPNHRPVALPDIKIEDYDPKDQDYVELRAEHRGEELEGFCRREGDFLCSKPLKLNAGIVYVTGNFTCDAPISGLGCIVVKGKTKIQSANLANLQKLAIVSGGDLEITGGGKSSTRLRGLLYSRGNLTLSDVTVLGSVISGTQDREMKLTNVDVLGTREGVQFSFEVGFSVTTQVTMPADPRGGVPASTLRLKQRKDAKSGEMRAARPSDFLGADGKSVLVMQGGQWTIPDNRLDDFFELVDAGTGKEVTPKTDIGNLKVLLDPVRLLCSDVATAANKVLERSDAVMSKGSLDLDLNRFLRLSDKLKVVYRSST